MDLAMSEGRDNVTASQHVHWVHETECVVVGHWGKVHGIQPKIRPTGGTCPERLKPPDPQKIQSVRCVVQRIWPSVNNVDVIDSENSSIAEMVWVIVFLIRKQHDVAMRSVWIDDILRATNVVRCVVDFEYVVFVDPV